MIRTIFEFLWSNESIRAIQQFLGPGLTWLFVPISLFGSHEGAAVVAALALWLTGRRLAYALIGIIVFALATDMLLWQLVGVPRPSGPGIFVYVNAPVSSFPSGHVVTATVVWGLLSAYKRIWKSAALAIVLGVMLSRLYLGMHYLGDVLGGVAIGLILLTIYARLWPSLAAWFERRSLSFFLMVGVCGPLAVLPFTLITDRAWIVFGSALGAAIGLLVESHYVRYVPGHDSLGQQTAKVLLGLGLAGALMAAFTAMSTNSPVLPTVIFALVALWLTLGAPALFRWWGLARHAQMNG